MLAAPLQERLARGVLPAHVLGLGRFLEPLDEVLRQEHGLVPRGFGFVLDPRPPAAWVGAWGVHAPSVARQQAWGTSAEPAWEAEAGAGGDALGGGGHNVSFRLITLFSGVVSVDRVLLTLRLTFGCADSLGRLIES